MKHILMGLALLAACSRKDEPASATESTPSRPASDGEWRPSHRDTKATQLPDMPTRASTVTFGKLNVRATITLPTIYVVGTESGRVDKVRELPADACTDDSDCSVPFHAESLHFPAFLLRVGRIPTSDEWTCDDKRCVRNSRKPSEHIVELEIERAYKVGTDALYCRTSFWAPTQQLTPPLEAWMARVCDELSITPR